MKKIIQKALASLLVVAIVITYACNSFAANDYEINYSGGTPLGISNVTIDPELTEDLMPLNSSVTSVINSSTKWVNGYMKDRGGCYPYKYFTVAYNSSIDASDDIGYTFSDEQYDVEVNVVKTTLEGATAETGFVTAGITSDLPYVYGGVQPYTDSECTIEPEGITVLGPRNNIKIFVELNIKLHKKNQTDVFVSRGLYFGITDIDGGQSFKILNPDNRLTRGNMYAENAEDLQGDGAALNLENRFVASGNYIYSQYDADAGVVINSPGKANVFVQLEESTQEEGLDIVFGFANHAGSGVLYYAKQHTVTYASEAQGSITGITSEKVIAGENPSGSTATPNGYWILNGWTANKDVTLENGDVIPAGDPITDEEIKNVVVDDDIEFTAYYVIEEFEVVYTTDGHGTITGIEDEDVYTHGNPSGSRQEPNTGYNFTHWVADKDVTLTDSTVIPAGSPITNDQIQEVVVTENLTFTAINEANTYTVNYTSDANGTITGKTTETISYESHPTGTTETPNTGYNFTHWVADKDVTLTSGTTITAGSPITNDQIQEVVVVENLTFTAINEANTYTVNYASDANGTITGKTTETISYESHPTGTTETPATGYTFTHWVADKDVTLTNGTTITAGSPITNDQIQEVVVVENLTFTAINEANAYTVNYTSDANGTITGKTTETISYESHPTGTTETPATGYTFTHWVADKDVTLTNGTTITAGSPITNTQLTNVVVTENLTFTAINEANAYTVNYTSDANGTITGKTTETISYENHPTGTTETPATGYNFTHWVADKDVTLTNGTTITAGSPITNTQLTNVVVTENLTFTAINEANAYTVNYTSDENGTITGETEEVVGHGSNPTGTTETPNDGYEFKEWVADVDINLTDGTTIIAGDPITSDQITLIIIDRDITLTAINQAKEEPPVTPDPEVPTTPESDTPVSPETGSITKDTEGAELAIVSVSTLIALISGAFAIRLLPRSLRKK